MSKRYVLFIADEPISEQDLRGIQSVLVKRFRGLKAIGVESNDKALIVRTDEQSARALRSQGGFSSPAGARLEPKLTSGAIGKLKKRATEAADIGKIHER